MNYQKRIYSKINGKKPIITMSMGKVEVNINGFQISFEDYVEDAKKGLVSDPCDVKYAPFFPSKEREEISQRLSGLEKD